MKNFLQYNSNLIKEKNALATMYNPPGTSPNVENFKFILNKYPDSIFMGDYNSKHEFFGCKKYNKEGDILFNIIEELNLIVSKDGTPTHYTNIFFRAVEFLVYFVSQFLPNLLPSEQACGRCLHLGLLYMYLPWSRYCD